MIKAKRIQAEEGSGNVFADLELPNAEQELLKARLTLTGLALIRAVLVSRLATSLSFAKTSSHSVDDGRCSRDRPRNV